jgi:hypothetical protein
MALADTLSTKLGGIPGQIQQKVRAGAEAQAGMESAVAEESKRLNAPIQAEKIREVGEQQQTISDVGKKMAQPIQIPQETVADFSQLGGLVAIAGVMLGTSGKMSAQNVLNSMTGIMDGYKKGRTDLIANYQKEFDMNQKRMQSQVQQAQAELSVILEKYKTRDQTVVQDIASFKAKYNAGIAATIADAQSADKIASTQIQLAQLSDRQTQATAKIDLDRQNADKKNVLVNPTTGERGYMDSKTGKFVKLTMPEGFSPDLGGAESPFMVDENNNAVYPDASGKYPTGKKLYKPGALGTAKAATGDRFGFSNIVAVNLNEAVGSISNIVQMPFKVNSGPFQGENSKGLFSAPLGVLANAIAPEDVQRYNTEIANFGKFASRVISGGRVVPASVQQGFEDQYKIKQGDKPLTVLTKIAQMRQTLERASEVYLADPNTSAEMKKLYEKGLKDIQTAIPFTVNDVNRFANERDKKVTFEQKFPTYGFGSIQTPQIPAAAIKDLKENPDALRDAFDETFGAGSADRVLGRR